MIFCFDAKGSVLGSILERVYQGSNGANEIFFLCPVDRSCVVNITARFSNGEVKGPFVMNSIADKTDGLFDENLKEFNVWQRKIDAVMSGVSGKVDLQFNIALPTGEVVATKTVNYIVDSGVPAKEPNQGDSYAELMTFISKLSADYSALRNGLSKVDALLVQSESINEQVSSLSEIIDKGVVKKTLVRGKYNSRTTANGLNIIDGMQTKVSKIFGETGENYAQGGLCDVMFKGIKSYSLNFFDANIESYTVEGLTVNIDKETGVFTLNGSIGAGKDIHLQHTIKKCYRNCSARFYYIAGSCYNANDFSDCNGVKITVGSPDGASVISVDRGTPFASGYVSAGNSGDSYIVVNIKAHADSEILLQQYSFKFMVVEGNFTEQTMPEYRMFAQPDENFVSPTSVRLGRFDYIDVERKKIVRRTAHLSKAGGFTPEELLAYPNRVTSMMGTDIAYETPNAIEEDVVIPKGYIAHAFGTETVVYDTNYFTPGSVTVEQYYYVKL